VNTAGLFGPPFFLSDILLPVSNPSIDDLRGEGFEILVSIRHEQLIPFVLEYFFERTSWVTRLHHAMSLASLIALSAVAFQRFSFLGFLAQFAIGVVVMLVFVLPLHEAVHAIAYWLSGARDIRWSFSWKMLAAYVVADSFVASRRVFLFVALAPFIVITPAAVAMAVLDSARAVAWLTVLLWHTAGVSGDWALLNYYWLNRNRELYTFDAAGVSYFCAPAVR
jgi:hypothetical protein